MAGAASPQFGLQRAPARPIRLLIVDDSLVARTVIQRICEARQEFTVAGTASRAADALAWLDGHQTDIILLDVEMPGMDGLTALPRLLERAGGARVLVVSSACGSGAEASIRAMTLGAVDTLLKPATTDFAGRFAGELIDRLLRVGHGSAGGVSAPAAAAVPPSRSDPIGCIAIGASTGGLHALSAFFDALPRRHDVPILVTQHLPASFMPYFAVQLSRLTGREAEVARDGSRIGPGTLLVAPGEGHIRLVRYGTEVRIRLDRKPAASGCLPSVDPMLSALAACYGAAGVAVVLSGMGRDGMIGAGAVAAAGGEILVQDEATSVVWGMPGAVHGAGLADAVLSPERIAERIGRRLDAAPWR